MIEGATPAANQPIAWRSTMSNHATIAAASGARFGRIAIATLIARPDANGRRPTASVRASVLNAVTGTSLIAFIS